MSLRWSLIRRYSKGYKGVAPPGLFVCVLFFLKKMNSPICFGRRAQALPLPPLPARVSVE
ncbi:MAG: hypothetical protein D6714_03815 [Bacteroidetes bacterium]|nr:MAG: hypothetical protein D6714_03815 [Bacteroidota bacterium]